MIFILTLVILGLLWEQYDILYSQATEIQFDLRRTPVGKLRISTVKQTWGQSIQDTVQLVEPSQSLFTQERTAQSQGQVLTETIKGDQLEQTKALQLAAISTQLQNLRRERYAQSVALVDTNPSNGELLETDDDTLQQSVLLAIESMRRANTIEGNIALRNSMVLLPKPVTSFRDKKGIGLVKFSPNEKLLAGVSDSIGANPDEVKIWDIQTGDIIFNKPIKGDVVDITFSADSNMIGWTGFDWTDDTSKVVVWHIFDDQQEAEMLIEEPAIAIALRPDGTCVVASYADEILTVWNVNTGEIITQINYEYGFSSLTGGKNKAIFNSVGEILITGSVEGVVKFWDVFTGKELNTLQTNYFSSNLALTTNETKLAVSNHNSIFVWNSDDWVWRASQHSMRHPDYSNNDNRWILQSKVRIPESVDDLAISPDGRWIAATHWQRSISVWKVSTGQEAAKIIPSDIVYAIAYSPSGQWLATGGRDGIKIWQMEPDLIVEWAKSGEMVQQVMFSPNDNWVATVDKSNTVKLWDVKNGSEVAVIQYDAEICSFFFSSDSRWFVSAGKDGTVKIFDIAGKKFHKTFHYNAAVNQVAIDNRDQLIAVAEGSTAEIWNITTKEKVFELRQTTVYTDKQGINKLYPVSTVTFSPDNDQFAIGGHDIIQIYDTTSWQEQQRFEIEPMKESYRSGPDETDVFTNTYAYDVTGVEFSPDGKVLIAEATNHRAMGTSSFDSSEANFLWDIQTGQEITSTEKRMKYINLVYSKPKTSPDGTRFVTTESNSRYLTGHAELWDNETGKVLSRLQTGGFVDEWEFSSNSNWLAIQSSLGDFGGRHGRQLIIWDAKTGQQILSLPPEMWIRDMEFSHNGQRLVAVGDFGTYNLLLEPDTLITEACSRLSRNLSYQEWGQYFGQEPYRVTCPNLPIPEE
jgi:WD40 repeat protein